MAKIDTPLSLSSSLKLSGISFEQLTLTGGKVKILDVAPLDSEQPLPGSADKRIQGGGDRSPEVELKPQKTAKKQETKQKGNQENEQIIVIQTSFHGHSLPYSIHINVYSYLLGRK